MHKFTTKKIRVKSLLIIALTAAISGCEQPPETVAVDMSFSRPAMIEEITASDISGLSFTGTVRAAQIAELSFKTSGKIIKIYLQEGSSVSQGQLLAELDNTEQKIALNSAKAQYDKAESDYQRGLTIFNSTQAISKSDLEKLKTERDLAKNKFNTAQETLDYTKITAPFSGVITKKLVNEFSVIQPNQPLFVLQNLNNLEAVIDVPSKLFAEGSRNTNAVGEVEGISNVKFPLYFRYFTLDAERSTQTYTVVLAFSDLKKQNVLPGMSITVSPQTNESAAINVSIPISAIIPDNMGKEFVWIVDGNNKVSKQYIETGTLLGNRIVINNGLKPKDRIVITGVNALKDGDLVRPLNADGVSK
ncbi:efflux RND transporter periplasmic adaptor subunit [Shewanella sp. JNE10-2]|uniref:efflux RND transporter periplasmic adaptor subunit n=1 Tax=unclassified Shewanella TaxID=196818 RepID=UPI002003CDA0|nr:MULTISPECIES: efflux RND transporter periplasmic adaptor subunit [unclassified Shewanella]MCK7628641.1 efflux RND transporter periplasmic adaptor subunit [Shewanella sp. JNE9-1]MCK7633097.1 efflux RND transporter periplasmic adaptor subunit [Shewanella sp. JNE17]MCK7643891.1 efflux RND transporter periplasmic adaptor subunit [Shewanella sp. JNE3-1]MCK7648303.1 efflux RND transporter periplasmic adaptor subunit [Shewanella sp. JNE8]MCK7651945.1 efflux RND transporter periplasmic adaptor subu